MNIFKILGNLYTNKESEWILELDDSDIQPYLIQRWLAMNDRIRKYTRWLDKYVFSLSPKQYLSLAWSVIPKQPKAPFIKYIKKIEEKNDYEFITDKIRKHFQMSDNDFRAVKDNLINEIKKDPEPWFAFYGIEKKYWRKFGLNFDNISNYGEQPVQKQKGLFDF